MAEFEAGDLVLLPLRPGDTHEAKPMKVLSRVLNNSVNCECLESGEHSKHKMDDLIRYTGELPEKENS